MASAAAICTDAAENIMHIAQMRRCQLLRRGSLHRSEWTPLQRKRSLHGLTPILIRLQVLPFPLQTGSTRFGKEPNPAFPVLHFPMLRAVVEFDVAGPVDLKPAEFM